MPKRVGHNAAAAVLLAAALAVTRYRMPAAQRRVAASAAQAKLHLAGHRHPTRPRPAPSHR
jgi:hypothetical protein